MPIVNLWQRVRVFAFVLPAAATGACSDQCGSATAAAIDLRGSQARSDWARVANASAVDLYFDASLAEIAAHPHARAAFERTGLLRASGGKPAFAASVDVSGASNDTGTFVVARAQPAAFRAGASESACDAARSPQRVYRVRLRVKDLTPLGRALLEEHELFAGETASTARPYESGTNVESVAYVRADIAAGQPGDRTSLPLTVLAPSWSGNFPASANPDVPHER